MSDRARGAWRGIAIAGIVVLVGVSSALPFVSTAVTAVPATHTVPPGIVLALAKVAVLAVVARRVWNADVYAMQWSSMLILLFVAEGVVRAASDAMPSAALGVVEAAAAIAFFVAVLALLGPVKRAARRRSVRGDAR